MIKAVLLDLDGTVYNGSVLIDGAREAVEGIRAMGLRLFFFTNNSGRTRDAIAAKLSGMGIACTKDDVISSGYTCARYLKDNGVREVYVSGTDGLREEIRACGVDVVGPESTDAVVIGMDPDFEYQRMIEALNAVLRSKLIIACNRDRVYPCSKGLCPGCGAMVASIEHCSGRMADVTIGKPERHMFDLVMGMTGADAEELLVVGDTYDSDILMAERCGAPYFFIRPESMDGHSGKISGLVPFLKRLNV